jgi:hypothetical protein
MNNIYDISFNSLVAKEAKKVIDEQIENLKEEMACRGFDYTEALYKLTAGKISGLRMALEAINAAEIKILKG